MRPRRCACADEAPKTASAAATRPVVRMPQRITTAGVGFGDSNHDPSRDGGYLTRNPTMRPATFIRTSHAQNVKVRQLLKATFWPATFIRTSHAQNVALSNCRTLSYHTPLPTVDNAMVHNQRSVANSIPARGPPPCTHSPPLSR